MWKIVNPDGSTIEFTGKQYMITHVDLGSIECTTTSGPYLRGESRFGGRYNKRKITLQGCVFKGTYNVERASQNVARCFVPGQKIILVNDVNGLRQEIACYAEEGIKWSTEKEYHNDVCHGFTVTLTAYDPWFRWLCNVVDGTSTYVKFAGQSDRVIQTTGMDSYRFINNAEAPQGAIICFKPTTSVYISSINIVAADFSMDIVLPTRTLITTSQYIKVDTQTGEVWLSDTFEKRERTSWKGYVDPIYTELLTLDYGKYATFNIHVYAVNVSSTTDVTSSFQPYTLGAYVLRQGVLR